jgi:hypothetical protein
VVGGWALSGIFNFEGGQYFTPYSINSPGILNSPIYDRPNLIGDPFKAGMVAANPTCKAPARVKTVQSWYNQCAFGQAAQYTFGNAGRNSLLGPGYGEVDLSLTKAFAITETTHIDLKWDVFNALNRVNLTTPTCSGAAFVDYVNAGQICSIVNFRRRMQLGVHLTF